MIVTLHWHATLSFDILLLIANLLKLPSLLAMLTANLRMLIPISNSTSHWFIIIIEIVVQCGFRDHTHLRLVDLIFRLMEILSCCLELCPIHTCLLKMLDSVFKNLLLFDKFSDIVVRIFASVLFQNLNSISQILIFTLKQEDL